MKYIKTFEDIITEPQKGEYVICYDDDEDNIPQYNEFIKSNIGKIIGIDSRNKEYPYIIEYENIPNVIWDLFDNFDDLSNCRRMKREHIINHSKNIDELQPYVQAIKYNL